MDTIINLYRSVDWYRAVLFLSLFVLCLWFVVLGIINSFNAKVRRATYIVNQAIYTWQEKDPEHARAMELIKEIYEGILLK